MAVTVLTCGSEVKYERLDQQVKYKLSTSDMKREGKNRQTYQRHEEMLELSP